jgi:Flp pilus assembly protein TadB
VSQAQYGLLTAFAVLVAGAGVVLVAAGWSGWSPGHRAGGGSRRLGALRSRAWAGIPPGWRRCYKPLAAIATVVGLGVWLLSGWPVHGLLAAGVVLGLPWVWHPGGSGKVRIGRLEELAQWLQQVASLHAAGIALEQTIAASAPNAPAGLRGPVGQLAARLQVGWRPEDAYHAFAEDLEDGAADHVVMLLLSHARDRGAGLSGALKQLGKQVAEDTAMLRRVDAERASLRAEARWITVILVVLGTAVISSGMAVPYQNPPGQAVLLIIGAGVVAVLGWMRRIAATAPDPRMLIPKSPGITKAGGS